MWFFLFRGDWETVSTMEDLTKSWSCLTLSDQEGSGLRLTEDEAAPEFTLAVKFLTKRALNIEVFMRIKFVFSTQINVICTGILNSRDKMLQYNYL